MDIYTEYVESLTAGEPPAPERDEAVCRQLRSDLRWAMARRGLWHASPALLGVVGSSWSLDLLEDLVHDAYLYNFADRLWHLSDRLLVGVSLRPLVSRNLENFLSERQKALDPIGHRIFARLCAALRGAVLAGELHLKDAAPAEGERVEISNLTLLGLRRGLTAVASQEELEEAVYGWDEELFAELTSAETNAVARVVEGLERRVLELRAVGIEAFRFKDLVDPLKRRARRWWESAVAEDLGETVRERREPDGPPVPVVIVRGDDEPDSARRLALVVRCVSRRIAELDDARTREQLWQVWETVRSCSAQGVPRPSFSKLGKALGIPRERRLPKLFEVLGEMTEECRHCRFLGTEPEAARREPERTRARAAQGGR